MSYILDALNKSENERRAAAAPGLMPGASFVVAPRKNSRRGSAAFAIGIGMLVTGLALGSWRPWQSQPGAAAPRMVALSTAEMPLVPAAAPKVPAKPVAGPVPVAKAAQAAQPAPAGEKSKAKAVTRTPPPAKAEVAVAPVASVVAAAPAAPREKRVVSYRDLPASVRQSLPEISFGGFAGTDDDAVNIAFINNRLVKAGEEVSPGLKLESVAHDGVVMAYQGHRFKP
jgi:general secretion pathway protein B